MVGKKVDTENLVNMFEMATELQEPIWKRKKIKADSLFFIRSYGKFLRFPCDGYIYYEREDKVWWVDGIKSQAVPCRNRLVGQFLLAMGQGRPMRLFDDDPGAFYKYDDGALNFIRIYEQDELQEMLLGRGFSWLVITFFQFCQSELKQHNWLTGEVNSSLNSWDKLWLAFVMREKFNKRWDKEKWVKIEKD